MKKRVLTLRVFPILLSNYSTSRERCQGSPNHYCSIFALHVYFHSEELFISTLKSCLWRHITRTEYKAVANMSVAKELSGRGNHSFVLRFSTKIEGLLNRLHAMHTYRARIGLPEIEWGSTYLGIKGDLALRGLGTLYSPSTVVTLSLQKLLIEDMRQCLRQNLQSYSFLIFCNTTIWTSITRISPIQGACKPMSTEEVSEVYLLYTYMFASEFFRR